MLTMYGNVKALPPILAAMGLKDEAGIVDDMEMVRAFRSQEIRKAHADALGLKLHISLVNEHWGWFEAMPLDCQFRKLITVLPEMQEQIRHGKPVAVRFSISRTRQGIRKRFLVEVRQGEISRVETKLIPLWDEGNVAQQERDDGWRTADLGQPLYHPVSKGRYEEMMNLFQRHAISPGLSELIASEIRK